jgi:MSHA biogenesis protein MshO
MSSLKSQVSSLKLKDAPGALSTRNFKHQTSNLRLREARGFTLIEMIVVIVITGIIGAVVAVFIRRPVEGYIDAARRAELTDIADTALRRITRDVRTALPNSVRITTAGNVTYLEYLQTSGGGRYRAEPDSSGAGDILNFVAADASFDVIGTMPTLAAGNSIVIYNLSPTGSIANAYSDDNRGAYSSNTATTITLSPAKLFPYQSPGKRFQVVEHAVTYACDPVGAKTVRRFAGYAIQPAQPNDVAAVPLSTAPSNALLASNITDCSFTYSVSGPTARTGVLALNLQVEQAGEKVQLFQQVHVNNVP